MKRLLFLFIIVLPLMVKAQYFTPDLPKDRGLYLFVSPNLGSMHTEWMIMSGERILVEKVQDNGWCLAKYVKESKEHTGYLKMKTLNPLDDIAKEMKETAVKRAAWEKQLINWLFILAVIGLVVSLLKFFHRKFGFPDLGIAGTVILYTVIMVMCGLEIWFLTTTDGFTFYSPNVVGWKWAIVWFIAYLAFILVQSFVWHSTLFSIVRTKSVVGNAIFIPLLAGFAAIIALILSFFWPVIEQYVGTGVMIAVIISTIYLFINATIKDGITVTLLLTPLYAVGIAAIGLMLIDVVYVLIIALFAFTFFKSLLTGSSKGGTILDDMGSKKRSLQEEIMAQKRMNGE